MTRYVQHLSGQGAKWEVLVPPDYPDSVDWAVRDPSRGPRYLPKSEYRLCEPPERWVDVTTACDWHEYRRFLNHMHGDVGFSIFEPGGYLNEHYRLRKIHVGPPDNRLGWPYDWAFLIERRRHEPPV